MVKDMPIGLENLFVIARACAAAHGPITPYVGGRLRLTLSGTDGAVHVTAQIANGAIYVSVEPASRCNKGDHFRSIYLVQKMAAPTRQRLRRAIAAAFKVERAERAARDAALVASHYTLDAGALEMARGRAVAD